MSSIHTIYGNLFSTYGLGKSNRYDLHRKSDLRQVYHTMLQLNKESPLYKVYDLTQASTLAIALKSCTHEIQNAVSELTNSDDGMQQTFRKRIAVSSQPDSVTVTYIGDDKNETEGLSIELKGLATAQINTGHYLSEKKCDLPAGEYSFDLDTPSNGYEFQFNIKPSDTNLDVQKKIASLVNQAHIGLRADVISNKSGEHALQFISQHTGLEFGQRQQFWVSPEPTEASMQALQTLGISQVSHSASNATFLINGKPEVSSSNQYIADGIFDLTFHKMTDASAVNISFKPDSDAIFDHIETLAGCYNHLMDTARNCIPDGHRDSRLLHLIRASAEEMQETLHSSGFAVQEDGYVAIDREKLAQTLEETGAQDFYSYFRHFADTLYHQANTVSLDPIRYVDKVIVVYKKPGNNLSEPYFTSLYAGMLYDRRS